MFGASMIRVASRIARGAAGIVVGYLLLLTDAAISHPRHTRGTTARLPTRRYAVLIPAHDEQRLIASTLASLSALDYPAELVGIHVVADNCTDATADIVRAAGYEAHERHDPQHPGKGSALQWLMATLADRNELGDVIVFIDADTTVDPGFLRAVDRAFDAGASVVQGHYAVRDAGDSAVVAFRAAAMAARTYLRPLGRNAIGGSAGLHGNGMAFSIGVMGAHRWSDHLTEDAELALDLLLDGTLVKFAPDAKIEAEMPETLEAARSQQERWERGRIELAARYGPRLLGRVLRGGPASRVAYADAALDQLVPPLSVVAASTGLWGMLAAGRVALSGGRRHRGELVAATVANAAILTHVLAALRLTKAPRSTYCALLQAPRMIAWKIGVWFEVLLRRRRIAWMRTARNQPT